MKTITESPNNFTDGKRGTTLSADYVQIRDLTDEEWLKLPKEEILQLYKNCYKMLTDLIQQRQMLIVLRLPYGRY
jgi:hypothetical protein